jgi:glycerol-3-phosphate dehydrogenase
VLPGLYEAEVRYLIDHEWAVDADDILRRRSKLGLHLPPDAARTLNDWIARQS